MIVHHLLVEEGLLLVALEYAAKFSRPWARWDLLLMPGNYDAHTVILDRSVSLTGGTNTVIRGMVA